MEFIKPFDECHLRFIKRPIRPATSVSHTDYLWKNPIVSAAPSKIILPSAVATTKIVIERSKPGYSKYLDPNATTQRLAYTTHSLTGGIGTHDNITYWNWKNNQNLKVFPSRDEQLCDELPSQKCTKRRNEFASKVKHVPHGGMSTEIRSNYIKPEERAIDFDITDIRNQAPYLPIIPFAKKSEYNMYGSGDRTQKYV